MQSKARHFLEAHCIGQSPPPIDLPIATTGVGVVVRGASAAEKNVSCLIIMECLLSIPSIAYIWGTTCPHHITCLSFWRSMRIVDKKGAIDNGRKHEKLLTFGSGTEAEAKTGGLREDVGMGEGIGRNQEAVKRKREDPEDQALPQKIKTVCQ